MSRAATNDHGIAGKLLSSHRRDCDEIIDIPDEAIGIYAYFLKDEGAIPIELDTTRVLYVGMTEASFKKRNAFLHPDSSFSSPRRSLGAILKSEGILTLAAQPRGGRNDSKAAQNFHFGEGEAALTRWMADNLCYCNVPIDGDIRATEAEVIRRLSPPLNLTFSKNPSCRAVKEARRICSAEAAAVLK